jgi:hypothetical protein
MPYYTDVTKTTPPMLFRINYSDDLSKEDKVMVIKWSSINAVVKMYSDKGRHVIRVYFQDTWYQWDIKACPDAVTLFETWNNCATLPAIG